jgi:hypothetical protein
VRPLITRHRVKYDAVVLAVGVVLVLVGFALVVPRGAMPGSTSARNVVMGSQRVFTTRGYQGTPSRRFRLIQVLMGLVVVAGGIVLIAASG